MDVAEESRREPRSRAWVGRAVFEAGLIVLGLVGALLVDEWRDLRERNARVSSALSSIRGELEANQKAVAAAIANHESVRERLREAADSGRTYEGGIINNPGFSTVAWDSARDAAITNDVDHETLITLGHAYTALSAYIEDRRVFSTYLYTNDTGTLRKNPQGLAGWLNDLGGRAKNVQGRLGTALRALAPRSEQPR